jgi:hypothetical protein
MDRFSLKDPYAWMTRYIHSTGENIKKITGRIMDVDETILSPM